MKNCWYDQASWFSPLLLTLGQALLSILGMVGPLTINLSHTALVSGRLWNNTMMLLKSDKAAGEEKQCVCVWGG